MEIRIGSFEFTECWDHVLYKNLSNPPRITDWELQTIHDFIAYEAAYGRECAIQADDAVLEAIRAFEGRARAGRVPVPDLITECTACPGFKGCLTDMVCHTSPAESAVAILDCGSLLSPVKARGVPARMLCAEARNAARDPEDYFEYIMFAWGNCQAGDRLVMERKLKRFPNEEDLSLHLAPGVRFFFDYPRLIRHPAAVFDGVLPLKIRDEVVLADWVKAIIVPESEKPLVKGHVPASLVDRVFYVKHEHEDIWAWAEKVYRFVKALNGTD